MELWQSAATLLSFWVVAAVGASLARRNWICLANGGLIRSGGANLMADEWHLSDEARKAIRQFFWLAVGVFLAGEGMVYSVVGVYVTIFA